MAQPSWKSLFENLTLTLMIQTGTGAGTCDHEELLTEMLCVCG